MVETGFCADQMPEITFQSTVPKHWSI